jgi:hypothetical protein
MAGTGSLDEPTARPAVTAHPVAGPARYVDEVMSRFRDVPRSEREALGSDLVQHLSESGCESYAECVDRFSGPTGYADAEFREGFTAVGLDTSRCVPD